MSLIDTVFSSVLYMTIIVMVWMFTFIGLSFYRPFKSKRLNLWYKALMFILGALIMIVPQFAYYGLAGNFKAMTMGNNTICLMEEYERGGGESLPETVCRLTLLDKETGKRRDRRYIGYAGKLLGQRGDTVAYMYNQDLYVMNVSTLNEVYHIGMNEWGAQFPELSDGVEEVSDNQGQSKPVKLYLRIKGKNGNYYWFDPFTRKLMVSEPKDQFTAGIYSTGYDLYVMPAAGQYQQAVLRQEYTNSSERKKIRPGDRYAHHFGKPAEESFIAPEFLGADTVKKWFAFAHYKTTDRKDLWIEAKNFDFKTLWKTDSKTLEASDSYNENLMGVYHTENGLLYFNIGGYMMCMEPVSGKLKWKVRL